MLTSFALNVRVDHAHSLMALSAVENAFVAARFLALDNNLTFLCVYARWPLIIAPVRLDLGGHLKHGEVGVQALLEGFVDVAHHAGTNEEMLCPAINALCLAHLAPRAIVAQTYIAYSFPAQKYSCSA